MSLGLSGSGYNTFQSTDERINDVPDFTEFEMARAQLSSVLSRLLVVLAESPELNANDGIEASRQSRKRWEGTFTTAFRRSIGAWIKLSCIG